MKSVLVVDDSAVDRKLAGGVLQQIELQVRFAENGREALELIEQSAPDLILTDLVMPEIDGLELVEQVRIRHPGMPVILMTAHGSEEAAVTALQKGAASYVPKKNLGRDLDETVQNVLSLASKQRAESQILQNLTAVELQFELGHDLSELRPLILHMQGHLRQLKVCDESDVVRISTALQEALVNAIEHGNLELDSTLRERRDDAYAELGAERREQSPYKDRKVHLTVRISRDQADWIIRDEGNGFAPDTLPDPTDPENLQRVGGRGLLLIRTFMDDVSFNARANEIRMTKRRSAVDESVV